MIFTDGVVGISRGFPRSRKAAFFPEQLRLEFAERRHLGKGVEGEEWGKGRRKRKGEWRERDRRVREREGQEGKREGRKGEEGREKGEGEREERRGERREKRGTRKRSEKEKRGGRG